jgi:DNA-binding beta-propeller fold protein YncE
LNAPTTGRRLRRLLLCTALVLAPVAASASAGTPKRAAHLVAHVTFAAPAGLRPAGQLTPGDPFDAVLPSGRIVRPVGTSVVVGAAALGLTVTPNGRYAVVADGAGAAAGSALYVVDLETMRVVDQQLFPADQAPSTGLLAVTDPVDATKTVVLASGGTQSGIALFDLDAAGRLMPDATAAITTPDVAAAVAGRRAFVSSFVPADNGRYVFAVDSAGDQVVTIDVATRTLVGTPQAVGFTPFGAALAGPQLVISNEGLIEQNVLATPASAPIFAPLPWAPGRSSSLSLLQRGPDGSLATATALQMDPEPDGVRTIGGAHPSAVAATPNGKYAFVAMSNVDRIATVALTPFARVIGGTELRLYDRGPYGTQPAALAISRTGARVYVALLGIDAVAVLDARDPRRIHRLGLLPTGWQPTALALSPDGRTLYVANARGAVWRDGAQSTLQRIDLTRVALRSTTRQTLSYERTLTPVRPNPIVPQLLGARSSAAVKHVVLVLAGDRTFDAMLGDVGSADPLVASVGDPSLVQFGATVTPNLHALARTFALAGNFYADAADPGLGDAISSDGIESAYTLRIEEHGPQRRALAVAGKDPDDYPRLGYIFNSLLAHHETFRDYGSLLRVSGFRAGGTYLLDVPTLAALSGNVDEAYPAADPSVSNVTRAREFVRDYGQSQPDYAAVWLPNGSTGVPTDSVADQDRALGMIVDALTHSSSWSSTAIFVLPDGAATSSPDHVDSRRTYAVVISPYARRGYVGMHHLSSASVLKTEEELLGLPALSLGDDLAGDMHDFFVDAPNVAPFTAMAVRATPGRALASSGE